MWTHHVESTLWVERIEPHSQAAASFQPWQLPGEKMLIGTGNHLSLIARWGSHSARWVLSPKLRDGDAFAYLVPAGPHLDAHLKDVQRHLAALKAAGSAPAASMRPHRAALVHMRTVQTLDATLAGATQREIACAVFGAKRVKRRWHPDSELRAQVRHLIRRGQRLMLGGYRQLLGSVETATGRFP